jgi:hypothetical protein
LADLATANPVPGGNPIHNDEKHAVIINEYGWLWLNRDGSPTTLTKQLYDNLLGTNSTSDQRQHLYALYMAAETEFWRANRKAAAVMQFNVLGYSRLDGQTSDNWKQGGVAELKWEPEFYKYVRDAFAPVGLMIGFWSQSALSGGQVRIPVTLINDLNVPWSGSVTLRLKCGKRILIHKKLDACIAAIGTTHIDFDIVWPKQTGECVLEAELSGMDGKPIRSVRELSLK